MWPYFVYIHLRIFRYRAVGASRPDGLYMNHYHIAFHIAFHLNDTAIPVKIQSSSSIQKRHNDKNVPGISPVMTAIDMLHWIKRSDFHIFLHSSHLDGVIWGILLYRTHGPLISLPYSFDVCPCSTHMAHTQKYFKQSTEWSPFSTQVEQRFINTLPSCKFVKQVFNVDTCTPKGVEGGCLTTNSLCKQVSPKNDNCNSFCLGFWMYTWILAFWIPSITQP